MLLCDACVTLFDAMPLTSALGAAWMYSCIHHYGLVLAATGRDAQGMLGNMPACSKHHLPSRNTRAVQFFHLWSIQCLQECVECCGRSITVILVTIMGHCSA
jgi:hypothetical protein